MKSYTKQQIVLAAKIWDLVDYKEDFNEIIELIHLKSHAHILDLATKGIEDRILNNFLKDIIIKIDHKSL